MAELAHNDVGIGTIAGSVLRDSEKLFQQELQLLEARVEMGVENKISWGIRVTTGVLMLIASLFFFSMMLVHFLTSNVNFSLWKSYGITGAADLVIGIGMVFWANQGKERTWKTESKSYKAKWKVPRTLSRVTWN